MTRRTPEADTQRAIVQALRVALPRDAIVHHAVNEIPAGDRRGQIRQSILVGMGVTPGFADLIMISGGRVLFLEVKSQTGRLRKSQEVFRDTVCARDLAGRWCALSMMRWVRLPITASPAA
jgi:hypothetical protein